MHYPVGTERNIHHLNEVDGPRVINRVSGYRIVYTFDVYSQRRMSVAYAYIKLGLFV